MAITSPTANTPSAAVRQYSSTSTNPLSSIFTPAPSVTRSSVSGRRPTETITTSVGRSSPFSTCTTVPPSDDGSWPVTRTPVRISTPRPPRDRWTGRTTSGSAPGRIAGSASSRVTWVPRSPSIDANSHPTTPPPMITARSGSSVSSNTSSEVSTTVPSMAKPGMVLGTDPGASTMWSPTSSSVVPSGAVTVTVRSAPSRPSPSYTVTLRFFSRPVTPPTSLSTTALLRAKSLAASTRGASVTIPNSAELATPLWTAAASSSSLAGIHPRFRHVPPTRSFSIRAMCNPAAAP